jgi:multidrug efflux pump subunit AcrA (membrane-fusion protein)
MKKLIAFVVLLILAGGGWWYWVKYGQTPEKPTINKLTISQGDIVESVPSTGTLEAIRRFDVGSQVSGTVQHIYVDYNDIVKKDQLLAEIDPSLLQVQVDIQKANIERAESDIASQEVQLEDQKRQFERTKKPGRARPAESAAVRGGRAGDQDAPSRRLNPPRRA